MTGQSGIASYLRMIKFSHTLFALPFAFTSAILAAKGVPALKEIFWITIAMIGARSGAMGMNRIIDRKIDAANPRTKERELPSGVIKLKEAVLFTAFSLIVFLVAAYMLNPLCIKLAPVILIILFIYSYTKRFTWLSHLFLGLTISLAPLGAWIAITGKINVEILPLMIAVVFWLAGFDIIYALQDIDFDRQNALYSIPQRFGVEKALIIARSCHLLTWILLLMTGEIFDLGYIYYLSMIIIAGLLIYEHSIVKPHDLSRLDIAFFNMNGYISVTIFAFTLVDIIVK